MTCAPGLLWVTRRLLTLLAVSALVGALQTASLTPKLLGTQAKDAVVSAFQYTLQELSPGAMENCSYNTSYWHVEVWVPEADPALSDFDYTAHVRPRVFLLLSTSAPKFKMDNASNTLIDPPPLWTSQDDSAERYSRPYFQLFAPLSRSNAGNQTLWHLVIVNADSVDFAAKISVACLPLATPRPCPRPTAGAQCSGQGTCKSDRLGFNGAPPYCECKTGFGDYGCQLPVKTLLLGSGDTGEHTFTPQFSGTSRRADYEFEVPSAAISLMVEQDAVGCCSGGGRNVTLPVLVVKPFDSKTRDAPRGGLGAGAWELTEWGDARAVALRQSLQAVGMQNKALQGGRRWYITLYLAEDLPVGAAVPVRVRWSSAWYRPLCPENCNGGICRIGYGDTTAGGTEDTFTYQCDCTRAGAVGAYCMSALPWLSVDRVMPRLDVSNIVLLPGTWAAVGLDVFPYGFRVFDPNTKDLIVRFSIAPPPLGPGPLVVITTNLPTSWPISKTGGIIIPENRTLNGLYSTASSSITYTIPAGTLRADLQWYLVVLMPYNTGQQNLTVAAGLGPYTPPAGLPVFLVTVCVAAVGSALILVVLCLDQRQRRRNLALRSQGVQPSPTSAPRLLFVGETFIYKLPPRPSKDGKKGAGTAPAPPVAPPNDVQPVRDTAPRDVEAQLPARGEAIKPMVSPLSFDPAEGGAEGGMLASALAPPQPWAVSALEVEGPAAAVAGAATRPTSKRLGSNHGCDKEGGEQQGMQEQDMEQEEPTEQGDADDLGDCCATCLCAYQEGEQLRRLPCNHVFHCGCIDPWLQDKTSCPLCRLDLAAASSSDGSATALTGPANSTAAAASGAAATGAAAAVDEGAGSSFTQPPALLPAPPASPPDAQQQLPAFGGRADMV